MAENDSEKQEHSERWERDLIAQLAFAGLQEQRRARRWHIFFRLMTLAVLLLAVLAFLEMPDRTMAYRSDHTAMVELDGIILDGTENSARHVNEALREAFEQDNSAGVILKVNSPGGSPVQAAYINEEIARLREEYPDKPVHAVVSDVCASGGYYVAVAAERIYAHPASIVGSIGVRMGSFGFVGLMDKLGIDRRLLTAGQHKDMLDPFQPVDEGEQRHAQAMLDKIHGQFVEAVKEGRGDRLADSEDLFSGLIWTGQEAHGLGLVDAFADVDHVAREVIGEEKVVDYSYEEDLFTRLTQRVGSAVSTAIETVLMGEPAYRVR